MVIFVSTLRRLLCFDAHITVATSVIMSITGAQPFNPSKDQDVAVAYVSAFILVYMVLSPLSSFPFLAQADSVFRSRYSQWADIY